MESSSGVAQPSAVQAPLASSYIPVPAPPPRDPLEKTFFSQQGENSLGSGMGQGVCLKSISGIQFGMFTGAEMQRMAHLVVCSKELYRMPPNRESVPYGVLDPRLGISSSADTCGTCGRGLIECPGHWGVIVLELPVFHIGFLKATIAVLQNVCKVCSRVLLKPDERKGFLRAMRDPRTDSLRRTRLVKRITDIAKKCPQCPWCGALNGAVKKVNAIQCFRLLHDRYKLTKGAPKEDARKAFLEQVDRAARSWVPAGTSALGGFDPNLVSNAKQRAFEELSPVRVMELFKAIPDCDLDLLWMDRALGRPETMLTTHILVPPVAIRPSVPMEAGGGSNEDDITMQLQKIVHSNAALKLALSKGGSGKMIQENWDWLQVCTAAMVNGEVPGFPPNLKPKRPIRGLAQRLKGKQGRFRGNLSGKRVDFSGRTVIGPDPNLPLFAVGVPLHVAKTMTYPERVTAVNLGAMRKAVLNGAAKYPGANNVRSLGGKVVALKPMAEDQAAMIRTSQGLRIGDVVERHMIDGDVVLFNRQPSLHKMSIMAHRARVLPGRTFRFNECVCTPYNADFDGDEMNLHLPQTEESRAEAAVLMDVRDNMINSRSGEPLIAAHQDFITAAWLLTQRDTLLTRDAMCQVCAYLGDGGEEVVLPQPAILTPGPFWTGKQVIGLLLRPRPSVTITASFETKAKNFSIDKDSPPDLAKTPPMCPTDGYVVMRKGELLCGNLDKSIIGGGSKTGLIHVLIRENSGRTAATALLRLTKMTSRWLADWGFSMGIEDVTPSPFMRGKKSSMVAAKYEECEELIHKFNRGELTQKELQPGCDEEQSLEVLVGKELGDLRKELGEMCSRELPYANPPRIMAICGSKGQNLNISQMIACVGQQQVGGSRVQDGFVNRTLPIFNHGAKDPSAKGFVANSFFSGLSATEFFMHTMGGRESLVDTAVKTAETGYMQRRMMKSLEDCNVHYDGTVRTSSTDIVQFAYGDDGMDPVAMEAVAQQSSSTNSGVKPGYLELSRCLAHSKVTAAGGGGGGSGGAARLLGALGGGGGTILSNLAGARARALAVIPHELKARDSATTLQEARKRWRGLEKSGSAYELGVAKRDMEAAERGWLEAEGKAAWVADKGFKELCAKGERGGKGAASAAAAAAAPPPPPPAAAVGGGGKKSRSASTSSATATAPAPASIPAPFTPTLDTVLTATQIRELSLTILSGPKAQSILKASKSRALAVAAEALGGHVSLSGGSRGATLAKLHKAAANESHHQGGGGGGGGVEAPTTASSGKGRSGSGNKAGEGVGGFHALAGESYLEKVAKYVATEIAEPMEKRELGLEKWLKGGGGGGGGGLPPLPLPPPPHPSRTSSLRVSLSS